ncbi:MAG: cytochrome c5 family protein [Desulfuromonas sp.]|nr:MAG: cytochrome c5 family protein [Desulfuromonas sp.]
MGCGKEGEKAPPVKSAPVQAKTETAPPAASLAPSGEDQPELEKGAADKDLGAGIYQKACAACHSAGVAGAPKTGDKEAWQPRLAQGMETLVSHSLIGYKGAAGYMPARGGIATLSDEEVKAAVHFMIEKSR